jgi:glycosyltransferase involved in cell wall biosynthesis
MQPRPRVLVLSGLFPNRVQPVWGVHVFNNIRAVASRCDVRVLAPVPWVPRVLARGGYARYAGIPRSDEFSGLVVEYPRFVVTPKIGRAFHGHMLAAAMYPAVRRLVRAWRPDVMLAYFAFPEGFAAVALGRRLGLPVVVSCRGSDINRMARSGLRRHMIAASLRSARHVVAVSRALAAEVAAMGVPASRVSVVPNGVDTAQFHARDRARARERLGLPAGGRLVVCVSRLSPEKGVDVLLDAWARLGIPGARLVVVGGGAQMDALRARARALGVDSSVDLAGSRPHEMIPDWLAAADLAVLPSRSEGHPNAVVEALACGRPVVASAVGGVPEIITDARLGAVVAPGDADALARGLRDALGRTWDEAAIAAAGGVRSWDRVGAEMETILRGASS